LSQQTSDDPNHRSMVVDHKDRQYRVKCHVVR
jgi:hypothetical protein